MNIEKIKNYNQKMLAVITTAAVAFAVIGLFSFIFFILNDVFRVFHGSTVRYQEDGLPTEEFAYGEPESNKQNLFISYHFPHLVDTSKQIFVIPVTHQTQDEIRDNYSRKITFSGSGSYDNYDYSNNSAFINFVIYDALSNQSEKLFRQQVVIGEYHPIYLSDDILLVFEAAIEDTDSNGKINLNDNKALFIYSLSNRELKQVEMDGRTVIQYRFIAKTKDLIVRFGKNTNTRMKKDEEFDPGILCKYIYAKDQLITINNSKLNTELKEIAEGEGK